MTTYIKDSYTVIFSGPTCWGKSYMGPDLIEKEYVSYIMATSSLSAQCWNKTYHVTGQIKHYDKIWLIKTEDKIYHWIQKFPQLLAGSETLFIIDDTIADEGLDKLRQYLL